MKNKFNIPFFDGSYSSIENNFNFILNYKYINGNFIKSRFINKNLFGFRIFINKNI
jgi:hypothetical protein